ncbi:MAG: energy transducer TonB, partial [Aquificota bacterium]
AKPAQEKEESSTLQPSDIGTYSSAPSQPSTASAVPSGQINQTNTTETKAGAGKTGEEFPHKTDTSSSLQQQRDQYLKEKLSVISQIVQKNISYPPIARRMGWEGRVVLIIRLCEDGTLKEVKVAESSGYEVLDKNAMETVRKVAHLFPKPPVEVLVRLPVNYRLE